MVTAKILRITKRRNSVRRQFVFIGNTEEEKKNKEDKDPYK